MDARAGRTPTVVIADDHPLLRLALREELEAAGFDVRGEAGSGPAAVELAMRERPDICILDVRMPGGDGDAAAQALHERLPQTKVVLFTATPSKEGALQAARAGVAAYLGKELDGERLVEALQALLAGRASSAGMLLPRLIGETRSAA